jgi:predicted dehydrogenase
MVGHCLRFWPEYLAIKEMIDSGLYGPVRSAVFTRVGGTPNWSWDGWLTDPARSGSATLDLHVHDVDTVLWYFGKPQAVVSLGASDVPEGYNHIVTQYYYNDGPLVVAEGGWDLPASFPFRMSVSVGFQSAALEFNTQKTPTLSVYTPEGPEQPPIPTDNAYRDELAYFVECVLARERPKRVTPEDAAMAVALVEAEVESARTGKVVAVDL